MSASSWRIIRTNLEIHQALADARLPVCSGGADALLDQQGIDATSAFEDVGHSEDARELMAKYRIGSAESLVSWLIVLSQTSMFKMLDCQNNARAAHGS